MDITYLGHASFKIKGASASVVIDPYSPEVGMKFPKVAADIVLVSHAHFDHNNVSAVTEASMVISSPGEYETKGVSLIGIASYHDDKKGELRGKNTIYVIEMDGIRLVHLGDLGHHLKSDMVETIGDVDILMVPVGGEYTIGPKVAAEVVESLEPKIIIPMHYQMAGLTPDLQEKLAPVDDFLSNLEIKVERQPKLKITKSSLPVEEQILYILESK